MKVSDIFIYIMILKKFVRVVSQIYKKALKVQILNEVPSVGLSVAGLDHTKFGFDQFQSFLFIVVIVISILLKTTFL